MVLRTAIPTTMARSRIAAAVVIFLGVLTSSVVAHGPSPATTITAPPPNFATLMGDKVTVKWDVHDTTVKFTVNSTERSNYVAIAIGNKMPGSHAYVAWVTPQGEGNLASYAMGRYSADTLQKVEETLTDVTVTRTDGRITFSFERQRAAGPGNIPAVNGTVLLIWAMGDNWSGDQLDGSMYHTGGRSNSGTSIDLSTGIVSISTGADGAYNVHGILMFVAWGVLVPAGVISARYLKGVKNGLWLKLHQAFNALALIVMIIAVAIVINKTEDAGLDHFHDDHSKTGIVALALAVLQPINGFLRPAKPEDPSEAVSTPRKVWEVSHRVVGGTAEVVALIALFSGLDAIVKKGLTDDDRDDLKIALYVWIAVVLAAMVARDLWLMINPKPTEETASSNKDTEMGPVTA